VIYNLKCAQRTFILLYVTTTFRLNTSTFSATRSYQHALQVPRRTHPNRLKAQSFTNWPPKKTRPSHPWTHLWYPTSSDSLQKRHSSHEQYQTSVSQSEGLVLCRSGHDVGDHFSSWIGRTGNFTCKVPPFTCPLLQLLSCLQCLISVSKIVTYLLLIGMTILFILLNLIYIHLFSREGGREGLRMNGQKKNNCCVI